MRNFAKYTDEELKADHYALKFGTPEQKKVKAELDRRRKHNKVLAGLKVTI